MMLWEVDVYPSEGQPDRPAMDVAAAARELGIAAELSVRSGRGFLIEGEDITAAEVERLAAGLFADPVVESTLVAPVGDAKLTKAPSGFAQLVQVLPKPGVMDPVAQSVQRAMRELGTDPSAVRTLKKYWFAELSEEALLALTSRVLANDAVEQVVLGPLPFQDLRFGGGYEFELVRVTLSGLDREALQKLSRDRQLYLQPAEMEAVQAHFASQGRDPTDVELETIAQTWSEHCSHKTLAGRIAYRDDQGRRDFQNLLKETIFAATQTVRERLGADDWCVSVFEDNAGIVRFDDTHSVAFKVETHNHPSALEPYGGANTGIGGVIRDPLGTGLGAKPICNTDVFCFAPPDTPADALPPGVLHPKRTMRGVVSGVRDYGNRMGIPTVNGAIFFDARYLGNPLVFCGNVGLIPTDLSFGSPQAGDLIVAIGGRTGRDGIHGATFSSVELTSQSEEVSGGAVQIGNAITEKQVLDVVLQARDRGLYRAITDCGAGGFSSAVGEMGEQIGAEVWLERAPLKYEGLSYTEIWISEAQERMVLAVEESCWDELEQLCRDERVEATVIGRFVPTGRLQLKYNQQQVADLDMSFLHGGRPPVVREAVYTVPTSSIESAASDGPNELIAASDCAQPGWEPERVLGEILASPNVASKHWVIRQYDHEVQGGSVIKPLVGVLNDGPSDAAVVRPRLDSRRGLAIACGMNPRYGDLDTYHMAASAIDEAVRNCIAVGADPDRIAILDNFCWGDCEVPETLGSLVRAAIACYDVAIAFSTPFISGKDSLNNEFSYTDDHGERQTIVIPPSLLISAMGQVSDVSQCVTMDFKRPGNRIYQVGITRAELGGSHYALVQGLTGGDVPKVDTATAWKTFVALHQAICTGCVRACHDLSEGGLAVAVAEMSFAGGWGAALSLDNVPADSWVDEIANLFSESNSRFLCEVPAERTQDFEAAFAGVPHAEIGCVSEGSELTIESRGKRLLCRQIAELKQAWQGTLDW